MSWPSRASSSEPSARLRAAGSSGIPAVNSRETSTVAVPPAVSTGRSSSVPGGICETGSDLPPASRAPGPAITASAAEVSFAPAPGSTRSTGSNCSPAVK